MDTLHFRSRWLLSALCAVIFAVSLPSRAAAPYAYQGRLEKDGHALNGTFDFQFSIYKDPTSTAGADLLWTGTVAQVNVRSGTFSVLLGSGGPGLPDSVFADGKAYLEIAVKQPSESTYTTLRGRQQLLNVPFATASRGDFQVQGNLNVGSATGATAYTSTTTLAGPTTNGTTTGALKITSPSQSMTLDGRSIDSTTPLRVQMNTTQGVQFGGTVSAAGTISSTTGIAAPNVWTKIYDSGGYVTSTVAAPLSITIPASSTNWRYIKIFYDGYINAPSDYRLVTRINGVATASYYSHSQFAGAAAVLSEPESYGFYMCRSVNTHNSLVTGELTLAVNNASGWILSRGTATVYDQQTPSLFPLLNSGYATLTGPLNTIQLATNALAATPYNLHVLVYMSP